MAFKGHILTQSGSTTDIAIWSSVEQGLAITAGSLATLRPLFFIAMHKLGLTTRASGNRPSGYGQSGGRPAASGVASKADKLRPDIYKLSATVQTNKSDDEASDFPKSSPNWFGGTSSDSKKPARDTDAESQRSLRVRSSEEDNMHIMVSKSFYITDEERGSIASRGQEPYR
jgi:hypothetical protein